LNLGVVMCEELEEELEDGASNDEEEEELLIDDDISFARTSSLHLDTYFLDQFLDQ
jgi:hypothetical protein